MPIDSNIYKVIAIDVFVTVEEHMNTYHPTTRYITNDDNLEMYIVKNDNKVLKITFPREVTNNFNIEEYGGIWLTKELTIETYNNMHDAADAKIDSNETIFTTQSLSEHNKILFIEDYLNVRKYYKVKILEAIIINKIKEFIQN